MLTGGCSGSADFEEAKDGDDDEEEHKNGCTRDENDDRVDVKEEGH